MLGRLLALFLIAPIVELALLIQLGEHIGFWPTMGLIVVTGVVGSFLARREGLSVWGRFNARLRGGELPGKELLDGVIILVAGALLITPGVLTDVVGFFGLIPLTRTEIRKYLNRRIEGAMARGSVRMSFGGFQTFGGSAPGSVDPRGAPSDGSERRAGRSGELEEDGPAARSSDDWRGRPRDVPGYSNDA